MQIEPFTVDLGEGVPRMIDLVRETRLPPKPQYPDVGDSKGIDLRCVHELREEWLNEFHWQEEQAYLNR